MKSLIQFLIVYVVLFGLHTMAWSQEIDFREMNAQDFGAMEMTESDSNQPGLCQKPVKKCHMRELSAAEIDTAAAMADEVAFQLKQLEQAEKKEGRDFKVAFIGRAGTDLGKFKVFKDFDANGKPLSLEQLVSAIKDESSNLSVGDSSIPQDPINNQVVKKWIDKSRTMEFSHIGIALKNHPKSDKDHHWQVMHLLWTCDKDPARGVTEGDKSYIWEEGLGAVFADDMKDYKAQIFVPQQKIQNRIENFLLKSKVGAQWHNSKYNAAALANDLDQQNSNQWVLEVLAAALKPEGQVNDRATAQQVLRETGYMETKVTPRGLYKLISLPIIRNLLPGTICMKRQPYFSQGFGQIISVLSVEEYMRRNQLLVREPVIVQLPDELNFVKQEKDKRKN